VIIIEFTKSNFGQSKLVIAIDLQILGWDYSPNRLFTLLKLLLTKSCFLKRISSLTFEYNLTTTPMKKWVSVIVFAAIVAMSYGFQTRTKTQDRKEKPPTNLLTKKSTLLQY